ncbi:MAG: capsular polysaccharide biosynthesis protein [Ruminococcaceae bacterium]|nr:capsular polysaccharide biosynthesis protein [Oscillospiraceae bacterium]
MIDWHSHILPEIDDGSKSIKESITLLQMLSSQGVKTVIATPHFFANDESAESFIERRQASYEKLKPQLFDGAPNILLGAEVKYYAGISRMENLQKLKIQQSKLLLLEMPFSKWSEYTVRELIELSGLKGIKIILAHIERYMKFQKSDTFERLYESGIFMQVNASFFNEWLTRRKALKMLERQEIHFIGSDCHNITSRPPEIGNAFKIIENKFGYDFVNQVNEYGYSMLL